MDWLTTLKNSGLPATNAYTDENGTVQAEFSRSLTAAEWQVFLDLTNKAQGRRNQAKTQAALATALKTITPAQAQAYIETQVTTLATAKVVLKLMAQMLIALRDEVMPDLPEQP